MRDQTIESRPTCEEGPERQATLRRLAVLDRDKNLVGIVSLADMALTDGPENVGQALCGISEPGAAHSQAGDGQARAH